MQMNNDHKNKCERVFLNQLHLILDHGDSEYKDSDEMTLGFMIKEPICKSQLLNCLTPILNHKGIDPFQRHK